MPKKKKDFSGDPGGLIGDVIWSATKPLYKEAKRQERARRAPPDVLRPRAEGLTEADRLLRVAPGDSERGDQL